MVRFSFSCSNVLSACILADGTPATQINRIVSHPTMSLLVTAHEDKFIRIFDIMTGMCLIFEMRIVLFIEHSICRSVYALNAGTSRWRNIAVHRCFWFFAGFWKPRLLGAILGSHRHTSVCSGDNNTPRESPGGCARCRIPSIVTIHGERRVRWCRETLRFIVATSFVYYTTPPRYRPGT
jgi:hypothetical protein